MTFIIRASILAGLAAGIPLLIRAFVGSPEWQHTLLVVAVIGVIATVLFTALWMSHDDDGTDGRPGGEN